MKASRLLWLEGAGGCPLHGRTFPLAFGKELTFGRCCDADYPLPYRHINRWQFEVAWRGCGLRVRPLQAHRATFLNGRPLPADWTRMRSGDLLIAGEARLRVVAAAQPASVR